MRVPLLLLATLAAAGCHMGTRMEKFPAARGPRGATVWIDRHPAVELLSASDSALLVARNSDGHVALVHFRRIRYARFERLPGAQFDYGTGRVLDSAYVARLRMVARYAGGVSPGQLALLLADRSQVRPDSLP